MIRPRSLALLLLAALPFAPAPLAAQDIHWVSRETSGRPADRMNHALAFDSARGVSVLFGGVGNNAPSGTFEPFGDTWEWSGSGWSLRVVGGPSPRAHHGLAYDAGRGVTVLFGGRPGFGGAYLNDTWEWNGSTWAQRATGGPPPVVSPAMAYDTQRGVVLLVGVVDGSSVQTETWAWDGGSWVQRSSGGPPPRSEHSLAYDDRRGVAVLFGGIWNGPAFLRDTWEWDGAAWVLRATTGPPALWGAAMSYDHQRQSTILYGGQAGVGNNAFISRSTWEWNGQNWSLSPIVGPHSRVSHAMCYDSQRGVTLAFGGNYEPDSVALLGDTWELQPYCYANCDQSTTPPVLNAADFACFLARFAEGAALPSSQQFTHEANCDGSTAPPILNVADFTCFLQRFAAGCP